MKSMTGYGRSTVSEGGIELTAEVKSVNNRFLDLSVKSPRIFLAQEEKIRSTVRRYITRGHVDVFLAYTDKREKEKAFSVDTGIARAYRAAAELAQGDETCKRGDGRTEAADVDGDEQAAVIVREAGEQDGGRHVADDLAGGRSDEKRGRADEGA